jgi:hypothetical protein
MIDGTQIVVGTTLEFKKPHPCKGYKWVVLRIGIDYKLQCLTCGREITIPRVEALKRIKKIC